MTSASKASGNDAGDMASLRTPARVDYWLYVGIVVKVLNRELGDGKYYKKKGMRIFSPFKSPFTRWTLRGCCRHSRACARPVRR